MRLSTLLAAGALCISAVYAQGFINPPDSTSDNGNELNTYTVGDTLDAQWDCDWDYISLILWNDATASDGDEWIMWIQENQPNEGGYSFLLGGNIPLNNGSRFHLEVIQTDPNTGAENDNNLIDSESFNLVAGSSSVAPTTATVTRVVTETNAAGSTIGSTVVTTFTGDASPTVTRLVTYTNSAGDLGVSTFINVASTVGSAASATASGKEKSNSSQDNDGANGTNSPQAQTGMSDTTKVGLGVGLGLGIPLVIAAVGLGWWLLHRRNRPSRPDYVYNGLGTAIDHQDPLPQDPRRKSDPYAFEHGGQIAPVEKGTDERPHVPQELPP